MSSAIPTTARRSPAARLTSGDGARGAAGSVGGAGCSAGAWRGAGGGAARGAGGGTTGRGASATTSSAGPASAARRRQYHSPAASAAITARIQAQSGVPEGASPGVAATGAAPDSGAAATVGAATSGVGVCSGGSAVLLCPDESGAASVVAEAARGVSDAAVSRRVGPGAGDGEVVVGWVGVTLGGAGVGVGAGVGAGCCGPRLSFGATGGRPLSDGPCTPGARPSSAGGRRKIDDGAGVGVSASCARTAAVAISASNSATSGNRAALLLCPKFLSVIMILRSRSVHSWSAPLNWR